MFIKDKRLSVQETMSHSTYKWAKNLIYNDPYRRYEKSELLDEVYKEIENKNYPKIQIVKSNESKLNLP